MRGLRLYHAAARARGLGYRAKLALGVASGVALCGLGALAAPMLGPAAMIPAVVAAMLAGMALSLVLVAHLLRPVALAAQALHRFTASGEVCELPIGFTDEAGRLMNDAAVLMAKARAERGRGARDARTGLATQAAFLKALSTDPSCAAAPAVVVAVRLENYDQLALFEPAAFEAALGAFVARLQSAFGAERQLAAVARDVFAAWFPSQSADADAARLEAIAYVLGQEIGQKGARTDAKAGGRAARSLVPVVRLHAVVGSDAGEAPDDLLAQALSGVRGAAAGAERVALRRSGRRAQDHEEFVLEQETRRAAAERQFTLAFQPVVDLAGKVVGAEALLRWRHPELGAVPPGRFIPVLERTELMDEVGLWVLGAACREAQLWREQGLGELRVAVNLSARQLRKPSLVGSIEEMLERHRLPAANLEIELTETAAAEDIACTRALFGELHALGVSVAIDDFGAGYSSMSYLKNLPFDRLKIDREFVSDIDRRRDSQAISRAILELARGLGLSVLAEGVERAEEVETLGEMGCEVFQGYYFSPPLDPREFLSRLKDPAWRRELATPPAVRKLARLAAAV